MLVYNGAGFEGPWIKRINAKFAVDSSQGLNLFKSSDSGSKNERADERDDKAKGTFDPHIWLDPILAKQQVEKIREGLTTIDPNNAQITINFMIQNTTQSGAAVMDEG
jgi:zinc transport system substrate-binding protein